MVKQRRSLCFSFVGNSTINTSFWPFFWFFGCIFVKIQTNFVKNLKNDPRHAKVIVWKGRKFKSWKVSKKINLKWIYFVNSDVPAVIYIIFSLKTLQYWANAYSFHSMKLVNVFVEKNALKMQKIWLING